MTADISVPSYDQPADVLKDDGLSTDRKREILEGWKSTLGAVAGGTVSGDDERALIARIDDALADLDD